MTKTMDLPTATENPKILSDAPAKTMCAEFVQFCKEQHLEARAAQTFLHVLHKKTWEDECHKIREAMRPEVEALFVPVEKAVADGKDCQLMLKDLIKKLKTR
jgi:hypothetical protein